MPRVLICLWLVGVVLLGPKVFTADNVFVKEYGPLAGFACFGLPCRYELLGFEALCPGVLAKWEVGDALKPRLNLR
jgi:hypothetical protein